MRDCRVDPRADPVGATREETITVDERTAISFLGVDSGRVLATPQMIQHMEITSRNLLKPMLDDGYDSVGTVVTVKHLGRDSHRDGRSRFTVRSCP